MKINPNLEKSSIYARTDLTMFNLLNVIKLRTVCHSLVIETGRYGRNKKLREQRICQCTDVETEDHFLLKCPIYQHIRYKYVADVLEKTNIAMYVKELYSARALYT